MRGSMSQTLHPSITTSTPFLVPVVVGEKHRAVEEKYAKLRYHKIKLKNKQKIMSPIMRSLCHKALNSVDVDIMDLKCER